MPTPTSHKLQRNKAKQYLYRCIPQTQRTGPHSQPVVQAITGFNLRFLVQANYITSQQAKRVRQLLPTRNSPKRAPLPIKIPQGTVKVRVTTQQRIWAVGTQQYSLQPISHMGYVMAYPTPTTVQVYIPARGNTPALTVLASHNNTGVQQAYIVSAWLSTT